MPTTHLTSIYTPSLSSRTSHLSCSELAHIILTSFSNPSSESRQLVSFILQSVHEYSDAGSRGLTDDDDLKLVSTRSDLVMAVASRLEVDLKNKTWSGDLVADVRSMYNRIIFRLMQFLIETTGDNVLAAVNVVRSTLADTRDYLATSSTRMIERDIATTARKYKISYTQEATIEGEEVRMGEQQAVKVKAGLKSAFKLRKMWGKKEQKGRYEDKSECVEMCETDSCSGSDEEASDSGVSMGESESDDEWWCDEEVGVAL